MKSNFLPFHFLGSVILVASLLSSCNSPNFSKAACARLNTPSGEIINLELAKTPHEHTFGLMFREFLPHDRGMLFIFTKDEVKQFWMKNTMISLDILFMDSKLRIRKIFHNVPVPKDNENEASIPYVSSKARYVLEIKAGTAKKLGLKEGQKLEIETFSLEDCSSILSQIN